MPRRKIPKRKIPVPTALFQRGTAVRILKMLRYPDQSVRVLVQGLARIELGDLRSASRTSTAHVKRLAEPIHVGQGSRRAAGASGQPVFEVRLAGSVPARRVAGDRDAGARAGRLTDLVASYLKIAVEEAQDLLATLDVRARLEKLIAILTREIELLELGHKIQSQVQTELNKNQREYYLRQQLKAIQKELGEGDARTSEVEEIEKKIEAAKMPEEARKAADKELERLKMIPPESAEHTVVRTYLDWLVSLPWGISTEDNLDIKHARQVLDEDHYDLEKIKERILEFLAVRKLKKDTKGPILCFVGPPGTGKTSLGKSIARALGRKFVRLSLGGIRDEAEIRGHRRTYIGSLPGRIIQGMRNAGSNNPLFILDEVDKLGAGFPRRSGVGAARGARPRAEQHLLGSLPRRAVRSVQGAVPDHGERARPDPARAARPDGSARAAGLHRGREAGNRRAPPDSQAAESKTGWAIRRSNSREEALREVIRSYTREAGLRNLEREIARVFRKIARAITEGEAAPERIDRGRCAEVISGAPKFFSEVADRTQEPGVATGLAWTASGGDIMFIESTRMNGAEGADADRLARRRDEGIGAGGAVVHPLARGDRLGIAPDFFENSDIHVHVPAGAIPKDGPSAGVTIAASLASLLTGRPVRSDVAMTGEITLRGKVLPVGGIKEKVLAARRAGIKTIILPRRNERDLEDIQPEVRGELEMHFRRHRR